MESWREFFRSESNQPYMVSLKEFLCRERASFEVYPPADRVFYALECTPLSQVKVVIVGQDPYHGPGQAMGMAFSVPPGCPLPPSLRNIYAEIERDLEIKLSCEGDLTPWAKQGVLLLNSVLTVRRAEPFSHKGQGWEIFTDRLLQALVTSGRPLAFLLWGNPAQQKVRHILQSARPEAPLLILKAAHPSPLSAHRGFFGCRHFSQVNGWLEQQGLTSIDWKL